MNRNRLIVLIGIATLSLLLIGTAKVVQATTISGVGLSSAQNGWHLIWSDEFNGTSVDTTKWNVTDANLGINNELQYYSPDDVYIENGKLVLKSEHRSYGGQSYTSGRVDTTEKFTPTYGKLEVRAKLPKTRGIWPAHWMFRANSSYPYWELDMMEMLGQTPTLVYFTHWWNSGGLQSASGTYTSTDFSLDYHVFSMEWESNEIRFYVDGIQRYADSANPIPNIPMKIILNTAVGGNFPGSPDGTTVFPQYHYIDYVRFYERSIGTSGMTTH